VTLIVPVNVGGGEGDLNVGGEILKEKEGAVLRFTTNGQILKQMKSPENGTPTKKRNRS